MPERSFASRLVFPALGFILVPLIQGLLLAFSTISTVMLRHPPPAFTSAKLPSAPAWPTHGRPVALILLSSAGTELTDALAPYEVLAASGHFDVRTFAAEREPVPSTSDLAILPDYSYADIDKKPAPTLLVIPAVLNPGDPALLDEVRKLAPRARIILAPCEGARVAEAAGLLRGKKATSHFLALNDLESHESGTSSDQATTWLGGLRAIRDGNVITTAGVTGSIDGAHLALEYLARRDTAPTRELKDLDGSRSISLPDMLHVFLAAGFDWLKPTVVVPVTDGIDELALAAPLETFARSFDMWVHAVMPGTSARAFVHTAHGLWVLPEKAQADYPEAAAAWDATREAAGRNPFDAALNFVAQGRGGPGLARFVAKTIEWPIADPTVLQRNPGARRALPLGPEALFIALLGAFLGFLIERRIGAPKP